MPVKPLIAQGWIRALIYFLFGAAISGVIGLLLLRATGNDALTNPEHATTLNMLLAYVMTNGWFVVIALLMRKLVDRQSIASLGFVWKGFGADAFTGLFTGLLILCIGSLLLIAAKVLFFTGFQLNATDILWGVVLCITTSFAEEIMVRGYILNNLMDSMNKWLALLVSSIVFAAMHLANPNITLLAALNIFAAGFLLGINYVYTRNLWFGIFLHFGWNYFQGFILGYSVSGMQVKGLFVQTLDGPDVWTGGPFGFEASMICLVLQVVAVVLLIWRYEYSAMKALAKATTD